MVAVNRSTEHVQRSLSFSDHRDGLCADVDTDDSPTIADQGATVGDNDYGSFVLTGGTWTYTLDQTKVQDLDAALAAFLPPLDGVVGQDGRKLLDG